MEDRIEISLSLEDGATLRSIVRHGLDDCDARLETMKREMSERSQATTGDSIPGADVPRS